MRWTIKLAAMAVIAAAFVAPARAQTPELTERLVTFSWSIAKPAGWIEDLTAMPAMSTDIDSLETLRSNAPLPPGGMIIGVIPPSLVQVLGITPGLPAIDTIEAIADVFLGEGEVEPFPGMEAATYMRRVANSRSVPPNSRLVSMETPTGVLTLLVVTPDFDAAIPLVQALLTSYSEP